MRFMTLILNMRRWLTAVVACVCCCAIGVANDDVKTSYSSSLTTTSTSSTSTTTTTTTTKLPYDAFAENGALGHFTWGVNLDSGVDLTSHDMTMFELGGCVGYKNRWFRFLGVGASIMSMMNNSSRCYPVYGLIRTSFSPYHRFCFMEVRAGVSFNSMANSPSQSDLYGSLGVGFTLAHSRKFTSHLVLRATYMPLKSVEVEGVRQLTYDLAYASIGIGCAF